MNILWISSVSLITSDPARSQKLFVDALGLPLRPAAPGDQYVFSDAIAGSRHFGIWPLAQAAEACFGSPEWPAGRTLPQVSIEFEVESEAAIGRAAQELEAQGFSLIHPARTEPWGQCVARLLSAEGAIIGISHAPWQHAQS